MAGRASIVGAAETSVGKVRDHNEDAHFIDPESGIFIVCDGMGGHAAGEVASNLAVKTIRRQWLADATQAVADRWLLKGTPEARKQLISTVQSGVLAAHEAIVKEAEADTGKKGMGTTVVAAIVVGGDVVFAHCGDSRAYLVRDGICVQLTEDHTLLARLLAAGVDVDTDGDGGRFKSMLTNALGIGHECKVSTFVVPIADGDRFLLCSDGITEYVKENEIGEVLTTMPSPARSAQRLVELALQRGGGDNATALVVRVLEAGETARPSEQLRREEKAIYACPLLAKVNPQQRLRALRIALPRDMAASEKVAANTLGDRVAWILVEGEVEHAGELRGPGSLLYPEALIADRPLPDKDGLAITKTEVRALALRADDFRELCEDDPEIGEHLLDALASEINRTRSHRRSGKVAAQAEVDARGVTDPGIAVVAPDEPMPGLDASTALERPPPKAVESPAPAASSPPAEGVEPPPPIRVATDSDLASAPTLPPGAVKAERPELLAVETDSKPRQPRASTVPPSSVRARSSTDVGAPVPDRAPAPVQPKADTAAVDRATADKASEPPQRPSAPRLPRAGSPPVDRSSLMLAPAETEAAVEDALLGVMSEPNITVIPPDDDNDEPEIAVARPASPPQVPPRKGADQVLRPPAPVPASPPPVHHSEPEIQIESLAAEAGDADDEDAIELSIDDESARVVEILKDTSSQTIMLTVDEPDDDIATKSS